MGACATKPKVSKSDKDAVDAPVPAPEEVVAGVDSETTAEVKKEKEVVVAAGAVQGESVKEVVDVEGGNIPRSLSLLLEEDNQKAKAESEMTSSVTAETPESSSEPQAKTEESETKPPESQESAIEEQQPAPAVATVEAAEAVEKEMAIESPPAPAAEPTEKKTETAKAIAKEEAKE
ncbi:major latex allergen Hev b 5-like [Syzygium oleosum]|uniref:major latex allergen Hev b 5-like n=1 Tax=Syzygium oleosum TaxID=219896 RepID=UPI0024B90BDA|nr:major latex allergen Hev b 5-like [Syzygium oleosum]